MINQEWESEQYLFANYFATQQETLDSVLDLFWSEEITFEAKLWQLHLNDNIINEGWLSDGEQNDEDQQQHADVISLQYSKTDLNLECRSAAQISNRLYSRETTGCLEVSLNQN